MQRNYYLDPDELDEVLRQHEVDGILTDRLGVMITTLVENYAAHLQVEMVDEENGKLDAIYACLKAIKDGRVDRSLNPFAYLTSTVRNALLNQQTVDGRHFRNIRILLAKKKAEGPVYDKASERKRDGPMRVGQNRRDR